MADPDTLDRFVAAQEPVYPTVLAELRAGHKTTHWIWFIFPQIAGLGQSPTARFYAIRSGDEARAYLRHPLLGPRLHECLAVLDALGPTSAEQVFGSLDAMKFRSSLSLFREAAPQDGAIAAALERWFGGKRDEKTLALLKRS